MSRLWHAFRKKVSVRIVPPALLLCHVAVPVPPFTLCEEEPTATRSSIHTALRMRTIMIVPCHTVALTDTHRLRSVHPDVSPLLPVRTMAGHLLPVSVPQGDLCKVRCKTGSSTQTAKRRCATACPTWPGPACELWSLCGAVGAWSQICRCRAVEFQELSNGRQVWLPVSSGIPPVPASLP